MLIDIWYRISSINFLFVYIWISLDIFIYWMLFNCNCNKLRSSSSITCLDRAGWGLATPSDHSLVLLFFLISLNPVLSAFPSSFSLITCPNHLNLWALSLQRPTLVLQHLHTALPLTRAPGRRQFFCDSQSLLSPSALLFAIEKSQKSTKDYVGDDNKKEIRLTIVEDL